MHSDEPTGHVLSRRRALSVLGAAGAALVAAPSAYAGEYKSIKQNFDVIIIGAGLAGLTAARELKAQGKRALLLEARDRIGGRTWTDTFLGQPIERGGTWVDQKQPHIWRELVRYRIPLVADVGPEWVVMPTLNGFQTYDPVEAYKRQEELFTPFFDSARESFPRPFDPFYREDVVRRYDRFTLRDRLDQLAYPPEDEIRLTSTTSLFGGSSKRGGLTQLTQWWALSGGTFEGFHGVNTYRPKDGTVSLAKAILYDAAPTVRFNSPVAKITQTSTGVYVTTRAGQQYTAPEVIMAVPVNVWKTIQFSPPLPQAHREASAAGFGVPHEKKLWLNLAEPAERFIAEAPEGVPICIMGRLNDGQHTVAFSVDKNFDVNSPAQVAAAVNQVLPQAKLLSYTATDWHADEFALGVGAFKQPFQLTRLLRKVQQPHGRIKFATGDIANGWSGFMDGAIESGLRAAGSPTLSSLDHSASTAAGFVVPEVNRGTYRTIGF